MHEPSLSEAIGRVDRSRALAARKLHARRSHAPVGGLFAFGGLLLMLTGAGCALGELWLGHAWVGLVPLTAPLLVVACTWPRKTQTKEIRWAEYRTT